MSLGSSDRDRVVPSQANPALRGLRLAAGSLDTCMRELGALAHSASIDVRRLCAASFSAGRVVGYMEALAATDITLAGQAAAELEATMESVDSVRRRFDTAP